MGEPDIALGTPELLEQLGGVCRDQGLQPLAARLHSLQNWVVDELVQLESDLRDLPLGESLAHRSARHLLEQGGKRLRPMCVVLAAKLGSGFETPARDLALAVELIHSASLLHDDVIDVAERRRGAPAARVIYGNSASIIGGNSLLVLALRRVMSSGLDGLLVRTLDTIEAMVAAEALQLQNRGRLNPSREDYFRIVDGKTASLFRLALFGGAKAGGLHGERCRAMEAYGARLGVAFQLVDDLLDITGDTKLIGKGLFRDLREGKMTYPLILAIERDRGIRAAIERVLTCSAEQPLPRGLRSRVLEAVFSTGALGDCQSLARRKSEEAIACLAALPEGPGRQAFVTVAEAVVSRQS